MKQVRFGALLVFAGFICFSFSSFAFAERLQTSDLTYLGAFRLPETSVYEYACNAGTECDLSYRPDGDQSGGSDGYSGSLFFSNRFTVAEIRIPAPRKDSNIGSLNLATQIQSTSDVVGGRGCASCDYMGGVAYSLPRGSQTTPKLYWTSYEYYNTDSTDYNSIGWSEINLSSLNAQGSWHVGPSFSSGGQAYHGNKYGDYIFFADQTWADTYTGGKSLLVGRFREGGTYNGSSGPVLTAIAPWQDGNPPSSGSSLSAVPLMYFANNPSSDWDEFRILNDPEQTYYGAKSKWNGGAWVQRGNKKAVIIVGSLATFDNDPYPAGCTQTETGNGCKNDPNGYGPHCYGFGYSDCPGGIATGSDKGIHAGPYKPRFLFIDPDELAQVAQGTRQPNSIDAYASYDPSSDYPYTDTGLGGPDNQLGGIAYDQTNGFLYMMQPMAYRPGAPYPVIHVYSISGTPDTQPPTSPTSLSTTSPSQSSISVSWAASTDDTGVTGYLVERCQGSNCTTFTQVGTPTASPFIDSGLTPNTLYNYHVRATDAAGNLSGWSNVVGATTQAPDTTSPTAPSSLSASVVSSSNINLTWTASTDNVAVTGYKIERCSGSGCTTFTEIGAPTTNSYSDTGLSSQTLYRYRVRATDAANNNSAYSNISEATTPQAPPTPTFVAEYETAWNSATSPKTTANFSVQTGDILVAYAVNESSGSTIATPPTGTLSGTWTLKQTISATDYTALRLWSMIVSTNQTNVNVSFSNGTGNFGGNILHFRNASDVGITAQANAATGNPTLTLNGIEENSSIVMVNGDWSAKTGSRTYNTTQAGPFTETSAYADGSTYGVEAGYYANVGTAGNKTIGITAPTNMKWALAAVEVKGNPNSETPASCNTVTPGNFSDSAYNGYGAPYDVFAGNAQLIDAKCIANDTRTIQATIGKVNDTTRIVYTKGYYYDPGTSNWAQFTGTCTGLLNGEWCAGPITGTITDPDISTASANTPVYMVGMTCSLQGGGWKCGCRDTTCANFSWQVQGAGR